MLASQHLSWNDRYTLDFSGVEGGDAPHVTFVDDCQVAVAVAEARPPPDEYETDSGGEFSDREDEDIAPVTVSRSERPIGHLH